MIIERDSKFQAIEIKYQEKYRPEFSKNLIKFGRLYNKKKLDQIVVYLGETPQKDNRGVKVLPYTQFLETLED